MTNQRLELLQHTAQTLNALLQLMIRNFTQHRIYYMRGFLPLFVIRNQHVSLNNIHLFRFEVETCSAVRNVL